MLANYHTHTVRCLHAFGTDEEYVKSAIKIGYGTLGFSDHAPFDYPDGYVSFYKMTPDKLAEYASSVRSLKEKYREKIEIHLGLEAEYYPELWDSALELWRSVGIEYLILGQHFVGVEYDGGLRAGSPADESVLKRYVDTLVAAIKTEKFTYIAHPDMLNYVGDDAYYEKEVLRLTEAAVASGTPLEVNLLGLHEGRSYPCERFWEIASRLKPLTVIGADAHKPEAFERVATRERAVALLSKYGLKPLDTVKLRHV